MEMHAQVFIGAVANSSGIRGVASGCKLIPVSYPVGSDASVPNPLGSLSNGINWAASNGADVISNSWSLAVSSQLVTDAINNAVTNGRDGLGCIVVFSAANNNNSSVSFPASLSQVIAVGAISPCDQRKSFNSCDTEDWGSNYGTQLDVVAPGVLIPTTDRTGNIGYNSGGAIHLQMGGTKRSSDYTNRDYTVWFNGTWNNEMGYGLVNARAAVLKALDLSISGSDIVCPLDNSHIYSISNLPANANVTWTCTGGVRISGSNTGAYCSFDAIQAGYATLRASVNINGTTTEISRNIEISSKQGDPIANPYITYSTERDYLSLTIHTPNMYGIRQFIWRATPLSSSGSSQNSQTGPAGNYWTIPKGSYNVEVRIVTQCQHFFATATIGGYSSSLYPNPVDQTLYVNIEEPATDTQNAASVPLRDAGNYYDIRLYNIQGAMLRSTRITSGQSSLDVSGLPNGSYVLHVYKTGMTNPEIHKVIVSH